MEMDYNLKMLANFSKFSLCTDRVFSPESTLDSSFRKKKKIIADLLLVFKEAHYMKGNRELYM